MSAVVAPRDMGTAYGPFGRVKAAAGYRAARHVGLDGRQPTRGSGPSHQKLHRKSLQDQAREFGRDNGIFSGMIGRAKNYIHDSGGGFRRQVQAEDKAWSEDVERRFADWFAGKIDVRGLLTGPQLGGMICRELLTMGDVLALPVELEGKAGAPDLRVQLFESEQIAGSPSEDRDQDGIEKDKYSRPLAYWLAPYSGGVPDERKAEKRAAGEVLYLASLERPSDVRAVPPLQSAFSMLHRIADVCDSEALARQLLSRFAVAITREAGAQGLSGDTVDDPLQSDEEDEGALTTRVSEAGYGIFVHAAPGESVAGIDRSTTPGPGFSDTVVMFARLMGLPLGLPVELTLLDWTRSNYSQTRAVLEQAFAVFAYWQSLLRDGFYEPLFRWWLQAQVDAKQIEARPDMHAGTWQVPTFPWIDKLKEAQAHGELVDRGFSTYADVCRALNKDPEATNAQRLREIEQAIEQAKDLEERHGVKVDWRVLAGMRESTASRAAVDAEQAQGASALAEQLRELKDRHAALVEQLAALEGAA